MNGLRCLVTGATGYVGGRLVPALLAAGYRVRCLVRSPQRLREVPWAVPTLVKTAAAVTTAALAGAVGTGPRSDWYERLDKPSWQPPPQAFGLVWTPLYALIALAGARVLDRTSGDERRTFRRAYAQNLALNAAWTPLFFAAKTPVAALADVVALNVSNADLLRRAWRTDRTAAACLAPYVAWTYVATALNTAIVYRNRLWDPRSGRR